jgi:integrase
MMIRLSHLFTKCIEWGMMRDHPMTGNRFRKKQPTAPRVYVIDDQVIQALELAPPMIEAYCWLKLITGLRMTDLLSLRWSDWQDDGLHVRPSKTLKSTGKALVFERSPVLGRLMDELHRMTNFHIREYVFVNREGRPYIKPDRSANGFQSAWQRWMRKVKAAHGFTFSERQLRVKVGSDAKSVQDAAERLANDPRVAAKHYRAKPTRIKTGD